MLLTLALAFCLFGAVLPAQVDQPVAATPETDPAQTGSPQEPPAEEKTDIILPARMIVRVPADQYATLTFMNRRITEFRADVIESPPASRVADSVRRIRQQLDNRITGPVETVAISRAVLVRLGGQTVFSIVDDDLDLIAGETLAGRAAEAVANLERAIAEAEEVLLPQNMLRNSAYAAGATLLYILFIWLLRRFRRVIQQRLQARTHRELHRTVAGKIASRSDQQDKILAFTRRLVMLTSVAVGLVLSYIWLTYVLKRFPFTRPWGEALGGFLLGTAAWIGRGIIGALPGLFTVLVIFVITRLVVRLIHTIFDAVEAGRLEIPGIHPETAKPTRRIMCAAAWLLAIVVAYPYFPGSSSDAFKGVSVFLGLVISLGSTGIVNQLMSGFMLMYSRALRVGDYVSVGGVEGTVLELGMLSTKVRTLAREEVTVPNAVVISKETVNYTRYAEEGVSVSTTVTIGYDTPWRQVHAMLERAALATEGLRNEPKPFVLQTGLADHYPEYKLIAVIEEPQKRARVLSQLHQNIQDVFNEYGVQIMSPHYIADPPEPFVVPPDKRSPAPAPPEGGE